jgi:hypothetical protein
MGLVLGKLLADGSEPGFAITSLSESFEYRSYFDSSPAEENSRMLVGHGIAEVADGYTKRINRRIRS